MPVPRRDHLVVQVRPRPLRARVEQDLAGAAERVDDRVGRLPRPRRDVFDRLRGVEQVLARELSLRILRRVAARLDAEALADDLGVVSEERADLVVRPDVEGALRASSIGSRHEAVGVFGGIEAAARVAQIATHVGQRVFRDREIERVAAWPDPASRYASTSCAWS